MLVHFSGVVCNDDYFESIGSSPWDYEVSENLQDPSVRTPLLIAVVLVILLVLLCLLDFACCRINKVGKYCAIRSCRNPGFYCGRCSEG